MRRLTRPPIPDHGHSDAQILYSGFRATLQMLERIETRGAVNPAWTREHILLRTYLPDFIRTARVMLEDFERHAISTREERAIRELWRAAWRTFAEEHPEEAARNDQWLAAEREEDRARIAQELGVTVEDVRKLERLATDRLKT